MSKLRAAITFQHRVDEIKKIQQERMKENFAGPINSTDDSITLITDITEPIITIWWWYTNPRNLSRKNPTNIQEDTLLEEEEINILWVT